LYQNGVHRRQTKDQALPVCVSWHPSLTRHVLTPPRLNESRAQRIVWLLEELGLDYEVVLFYRGENRSAPLEHEKVHPLGKSPAIGITIPGQDKETFIVESGFIAQYLGEHFAKDTNLVPPRYQPGEEGKPGGETESWMRYQHLLHYAEGSLMLSNCSGSSWRSGAQAPYRSRLGWSAGALYHVLSPHIGSFHLYITGECFALPFSTKSSHFATALPLLLSPSFLSQNVL